MTITTYLSASVEASRLRSAEAQMEPQPLRFAVEVSAYLYYLRLDEKGYFKETTIQEKRLKDVIVSLRCIEGNCYQLETMPDPDMEKLHEELEALWMPF